jgi:hypothetical protein
MNLWLALPRQIFLTCQTFFGFGRFVMAGRSHSVGETRTSP